MAPRTDDGLFIRPLLGIRRSQLEHYLRSAGMGWREDSSNTDPRFLRNRVRRELMPLLLEYNPDVVATLNRTAAILGDDEELLADLASGALDRVTVDSPRGLTLSIHGLLAEPAALRRRLLRAAIARVKGDLRRIAFCHLDALDHLLSAPRPSGRSSLPGRIVAVRSYGLLTIDRDDDGARRDLTPVTITGPGRYRLGSGLTLQVAPQEASQSAWRDLPPSTVCLDAGRFPFPWHVRPFAPGDRIRPFGMCGTRKVKELFIDRKIPRPERPLIPLLFWGEALLWVAGLLLAEDARIGSGHGLLMRVTYVREDRAGSARS
jgi:tRNA(Ile)-lysidine synthase